MEINGKEIRVRVTGKTLVLFKEEFKKDLFKAMENLSKEQDMVSLFEIVYIIATQDENPRPNYLEFVDGLALGDVLNEGFVEELTEALNKSMNATKITDVSKSHKKKATEK